jgi:hypothetical protein
METGGANVPLTHDALLNKLTRNISMSSKTLLVFAGICIVVIIFFVLYTVAFARTVGRYLEERASMRRLRDHSGDNVTNPRHDDANYNKSSYAADDGEVAVAEANRYSKYKQDFAKRNDLVNADATLRKLLDPRHD